MSDVLIRGIAHAIASGGGIFCGLIVVAIYYHFKCR